MFAAALCSLSWAVESAAQGNPEACEFRVVQWNAAGLDANWDNNMQPVKIANTVIGYVNQIDANVVTLQEIELATVTQLLASLPGWTCHAFDVGSDHVGVCVDGPAANFASTPLQSYDGNIPDPPWWGYAQLEYRGTLITSVHTRKAWRHEHVRDLHRDVPTGIIGGDFNFFGPEVAPDIDPGDSDLPVWFQTDLDREWTWEGDWADDGDFVQVKIDHVLSVEEPDVVWGEPGAKEGSNHRVLLGEIIYPRVGPEITVEITNGAQPIEVDGGCAATVDFEIAIRDACCLDPDDLALSVTATNPTANATLGAVSIDGSTVIGLRDVAITGHVDVSALASCPAKVMIEAAAQDCAGNASDPTSSSASASVLVVDAVPPTVVPVEADVAWLWPPNHEYVCFDAVGFAPDVSDNCSATAPTWAFTSCSSSQPGDGSGDGHTFDDCILATDGQSFCARAERAGKDEPGGRRYFPSIEATDACGNVSSETGIGNIAVPHDKKAANAWIAPPGP
jgi:hypothetical protein